MAKEHSLGLALSGGGAKGAAHCGALQAFEEYGVRPDAIAGTSAGSIVAALYAAGVSPVDICNRFISKDFKDLLDLSVPKAGLFDQKPLVDFLREIIPVATFEELSIPLYVVASNLDKGKIKVFTKGELAPRVMASCSIPVVFYPTVIGGVHYVDGGVFQNLPVSTLKPVCDKVIGVSVHKAGEEKFKNNLVSVAMRSFYLMFLSNTLEDAQMADLYVELDTSEYSMYDLSGIEELFEIGYTGTEQALVESGYERCMPRRQVQFVGRSESLHSKLKNRISDLSTTALRPLESVRKPLASVRKLKKV